MNELPRGGSFAVPRERFLGDGTRSLRGGRRPGNLERRAAGRECCCTSRWPMGKKTWESTLPERSKISILRGRLNDHALAAGTPLVASTLDGQASTRDPRTPHDLGHPPFDSTPGTNFSGQELPANEFSRMRRKSPVPSSLSQDRTTKRRGLRPARCHAALLVLSRPLRAAHAVACGQPGQRSAARQTPHIPFFFQKNGDFSV